MLSQAGAAFVPPPPVSSAFAPPPPPPTPAAPPPPVQQTIKVDEGEIVAERQRVQKSARIYTALAAVAALVIGFPLGTLWKGGEQSKAAVKGAKDLSKDVAGAVSPYLAPDEGGHRFYRLR
jgi:hypothetical protein